MAERDVMERDMVMRDKLKPVISDRS